MKTLATSALFFLIATSLQAATATGGATVVTVGDSSCTSVSASPRVAVSEPAATLSLSLVNATNELVMQQERAATKAKLEIKLPQLPAGLYLLKVKGGAKAQTQQFSIR
ncbi:MAG: T9SS type A sorting domain-containing protein [Bacteroidota bacterium]